MLHHRVESVPGPKAKESHHEEHPWWKVMCLTGVDYFSTLSYLPGIAALAAGAVSPLATLLIVALTLFGMLPMYRRVAAESPNGQGSVAMLERLLTFWPGKLFVLTLLGFVATSWIITITLSSADATAHFVENPFAPAFLTDQQVLITIVLLLILCGVFLAGFKEAVGVAVPMVAVFLLVNAVVVVVGLVHALGRADRRGPLARRPAPHRRIPPTSPSPRSSRSRCWSSACPGSRPGVSMMPLVHAEGDTDQERLADRIANTRKLLTVAAVIMSVYLVTTSFITTVLVPPQAFEAGGEANGRALAYLAHELLGDAFGTVYDISSILILWFAGASAMAGLINIVPRYLPGYGMAPEWARAVRPVVLVYTAVSILITILFRAERGRPSRRLRHRHPGHDGVRRVRGDAVGAAAAPASRCRRVRAGHPDLRLRPGGEHHREARRHRHLAGVHRRHPGHLPGVPAGPRHRAARRRHRLRPEPRRSSSPAASTRANCTSSRTSGKPATWPSTGTRSANSATLNPIPDSCPIVFLEVDVADPSDFARELHVHGVEVDGYRVLRTQSPAVPNALAAIMLRIRDETGMPPHLHFQWSEGNPLAHLVRFILLGQGETATRHPGDPPPGREEPRPPPRRPRRRLIRIPAAHAPRRCHFRSPGHHRAIRRDTVEVWTCG